MNFYYYNNVQINESGGVEINNSEFRLYILTKSSPYVWWLLCQFRCMCLGMNAWTHACLWICMHELINLHRLVHSKLTYFSKCRVWRLITDGNNKLFFGITSLWRFWFIQKFIAIEYKEVSCNGSGSCNFF